MSLEGQCAASDNVGGGNFDGLGRRVQSAKRRAVDARRMGSLWKTGAQLPKTSKVAPDNDIKMSLSLKHRTGSSIIILYFV